MNGLNPYYNSIDNLPCYNFDKIISSGDYSFLFIGEPDKSVKPAELESVWENIYDEFIKEFGISEQYKLYLETMGLYVQHLDAAYNGGDKSQLTMAEVRKREAEGLLSKNDSKLSIYSVVSKFMGFPCRAHELTVKEFYNHLRFMANTKE